MKRWTRIIAVSAVTLIALHANATAEVAPAATQTAATETAVTVTSKAAPPAAETAPREKLPGWFPTVLGMQFNGVYQDAPTFHSPYQGPNSFTTSNGRGHDFTQIYGAYLGSQLAPNLQAYLDLEYFRGNGVSNGVGLAGYVNGDVIRAGSSNLSQTPYVARLYLRYFLPLGSETEAVERGADQIPGCEPVARWELKAGKLAAVDDFDQNRYANNNRTQFLNFDFLYNTAWDYAADTRGYSYGVVTALVQPKWRLAFGIYQEPNTANGADFDFLDVRELGYNLELTLKPNQAGTVVRLLSYLNEARMGRFDAALASARSTGGTPDLTRVEQQGGMKYGFALNVEQPLSADAETGVFGRLGWNDDNRENWSYVESAYHASAGVQLSGQQWGRDKDRMGIAYGVNGLSSAHRSYLAAGGMGMLLGDGRLNYGLEQVAELYYRVQLGSYLQVTPDIQLIQNPGYNSDRGPVQVYGIRTRLSF